MQASSCPSSWSGKSWQPSKRWPCGHVSRVHSRLSETKHNLEKNISMVSDEVLKYCPNCHWTYHWFHLTVDQILLKPTAFILLRYTFRHLWLLCRPPCPSWAAPLNTDTIISRRRRQYIHLHLTEEVKLVIYSISEASIRAKAIAAVIGGRRGRLHGYQQGAAEASQAHPCWWRLDCQFLWMITGKKTGTTRVSNQNFWNLQKQFDSSDRSY